MTLDSRVFGVGFGRTGTTSLADALNELGIKTIHCLDYEQLLLEYRARDKCFCGERLFALLNNVPAIANGTGLPYREIDRRYPGSRFVLTVREATSWLRSKRHYAELELKEWSGLPATAQDSKRLLREQIYGSFEFDEEVWLASYRAHVAAVENYFRDRPDDLLVMNIADGDGWEKLCPFIGLPFPDSPFPSRNSWKDLSAWRARMDVVRRQLEQWIPMGSRFLLIDDDDLALAHPGALPFLEENGVYAGPPPDSPRAISELARMRAEGAEFVAITWISFWWFKQYPEFAAHLRRTYRCLSETDELMLFDLRTPLAH
jgi:hypothetical protein